jgi:hypothetical protein
MYGTWTMTLHRAGYNTTTPGGMRDIQLVAPVVVHWIGHGGGTSNYANHIGVLTLQVPEPHAMLLLGAGLGFLMVLRRVS